MSGITQVFVRRGLIHKVAGTHEWSRTHAQCPTTYAIDEHTLRIYFATRDVENRSSTTYIECDRERPERVTYIHGAPCIGPGPLGTFDDSGAMPSWIVPHDGKLYLYYSGWNVGRNVPYRIAIGVAVSEDGGRTFVRWSPAPVLDRSRHDPMWVAQPCVRKVTENFWTMWYLSCTHWTEVEGQTEPHYLVKFAVSTDGLAWQPTGDVSLGYEAVGDGAIGRPAVILDGSVYRMYFSHRRVEGFRRDPERAYRLGYAESTDGVRFHRRDELFEMTGPRGAWESVMNEYATVYDHRGATYLVYNGDGFGREGLGYAVWQR